jgi:hypothetical protein
MEPTPNSGLDAYIGCDGFAGGVRAVTLDRRAEDAQTWRELEFGGQKHRVSVLDGYRLTYSYTRDYPFASLRVERSESSRYGQDREIVTGYFTGMAKADAELELSEFSYRSHAVQLLTKKALGGRTLGAAHILADSDAVIVTVFFYNQLPEHRSFQTLEEFAGLRDAFIRGYIDCVARKK